eukprot:1946360-Lingulodinium_polyedra.AAC.1
MFTGSRGWRWVDPQGNVVYADPGQKTPPPPPPTTPPPVAAPSASAGAPPGDDVEDPWADIKEEPTQ